MKSELVSVYFLEWYSVFLNDYNELTLFNIISYSTEQDTF